MTALSSSTHHGGGRPRRNVEAAALGRLGRPRPRRRSAGRDEVGVAGVLCAMLLMQQGAGDAVIGTEERR
jgi:hypothetical protein